MRTLPARHQYYFTYIMHEMYSTSRFKIGFSSDPEQRVKQEDRRRFGKLRGGPRLVELYRCWRFQASPSASYIEQMLIDQLRRLGFPEFDENNWFEIDSESLEFAIRASMPLIASTQRQEENALLRSEARQPRKPYGKYYWSRLKHLSSHQMLP